MQHSPLVLQLLLQVLLMEQRRPLSLACELLKVILNHIFVQKKKKNQLVHDTCVIQLDSRLEVRQDKDLTRELLKGKHMGFLFIQSRIVCNLNWIDIFLQFCHL